LHIHLTEKLRDKLHFPDLGPADSVPALHHCWYAKVFTAQRVQYILTTNAACLFSVVMPGRGISDGDRYLKEFLRELREHLGALGMEVAYPTLVGDGPVTPGVVGAADRSVVQSVNNLASIATRWITRGASGPREATARVNEMPLKSLGLLTPRAMLVESLLSGKWL
jgi:hypothetical protein